MTTPPGSPRDGATPATGPTGSSDGGTTHREYDSVSDAIPDPDQIHGARDTYDKGEVSSIGDIIGEISTDLSTLMRQEAALAKAEVQQTVKQAGMGAGMLAGAGLAAIFMLQFLSLALWWLLTSLLDWHHGWAFLIVAVLWAVLAGVLALVGKKKLQEAEGLDRTVETAKRVPDALKGNEDPS